MRVTVLGGAGYVGGELMRLLLQHPEVTELVATSRSQAGKPVGQVHPSLAMLTDTRFAALEPEEAARNRDVVFLALEHGASAKIMGSVLDGGAGMIVDLAADFRIHDARLHSRHYGPHQAPELVHRFSYGLADIMGTRLSGATAIAAPGCFATAAELALYGIAELNLASEPIIFAVTGSSGAGQSPGAATHHPSRSGNLFAYQIMNHRHEGEILEQWRDWRGDQSSSVRLMTHSGPFVRGIHATLHARLASPVNDIATVIKERFAGRPFVRMVDGAPQLSHVVGSNMVMLGASQSEDGHEVQVMCVLDNLIKGAGGQAIQAMNLALGLDETLGLLAPGPSPC